MMAENERQFRSATFGGFHKQDVLNYIESNTREHSAKIESLQKELDEAKAARSALEGEKDELTAKLESTAAELEEAKAEMEKKDARLAELEGENAALREKVKDLEPDAEAYRGVKDRTAGIELEAHCRAQAAEAAAQEHIKKTKADMERWMLKVQSGYDRLRTDMDATISHAIGELERVGKTLEGISGAFSAHDEELERLLKDYRAAQGPQAPLPLDVE